MKKTFSYLLERTRKTRVPPIKCKCRAAAHPKDDDTTPNKRVDDQWGRVRRPTHQQKLAAGDKKSVVWHGKGEKLVDRIKPFDKNKSDLGEEIDALEDVVMR